MHKTFSPLRYPGGKSQFFDKVDRIILKNNLFGCTYLEPFAGGAGVALRLLIEEKVNQIYINDNDYCIYAFWYSILKKTSQFLELIKKTEININEWNKQKNIYINFKSYSILEVGFSTFFLNRTNRSGILKAGPIGGKNQNGTYKIDCRFNKDELISKIKKIAIYKNRIHISHLDANSFIKKFKNLNNTFWFIDPPYYNKGAELYKNYFNDKDHRKLERTIYLNLRENSWILTYDVCNEIFNLYSSYSNGKIDLTYSVENKRVEQEYIFYNNLFLGDIING